MLGGQWTNSPPPVFVLGSDAGTRSQCRHPQMGSVIPNAIPILEGYQWDHVNLKHDASINYSLVATSLGHLVFRNFGGRNGNPLQFSCLGKPMDRGTWRALVHRVTKSGTWLSEHTRTHSNTWSVLITFIVSKCIFHLVWTFYTSYTVLGHFSSFSNVFSFSV